MPREAKSPQPAAPDQALTAALERLLAPLAELCIAQGIAYPAANEMLKHAFVHAARSAQGGAGKRDVSRVSTATGLTRREVARITQAEGDGAILRPAPATQLFTRWANDRKLQDKKGNPRPLKRTGRAPSFETLARSITQDVHPRSLLDELRRLGLARLDEKTDTVHLLRDLLFVPSDDRARLFGFLGNNVGDHLAAAVSNVRGGRAPHLEQALFADELSAQSLGRLDKRVRAEWKSLLTALVPEIQDLIDADRKAGRKADRRLRVGLYSFNTEMAPAEGEAKES